MSVSQGLLSFNLTKDTEKSVVTSFSGLPLAIEMMRALKVHEAAGRFLRIKQRDSGLYTEAEYVESFVSLLVSGGTCLENLERLRADAGLKALSFKTRDRTSFRGCMETSSVYHKYSFLKNLIPPA
jgi:hypothetical protein